MLWNDPANQILRPSAITITALSRGSLLRRCTLSVPVGTRLLVVSDPEASASTLVRVLAGLSRRDGGKIEIAGMADGSGRGWSRRVAHLGPEPGIPRWMSPREAVALAADLLDVPHDEASTRTDRALAWAGVTSAAADRPIHRGGPPLLQRTGLAAALIADPEVLLLDEPLRALDTHERTRLLRLPGQRHTIVIASRYPASEAGLVSHVALLRAGQVALMVPVSELDEAGLPLSMLGVKALADRLVAAGRADGPRIAAAAQ
ncbi:MAG TPA: ATP-binding cassette domain-containing protein [Candidatus Limnocylindria bacterium]